MIEINYHIAVPILVLYLLNLSKKAYFAALFFFFQKKSPFLFLCHKPTKREKTH